MSGSPHDLEIKAPEDLTTHHEEVKPEDSKSSTGSESHSSKNSSVTRFNEKGQRINDKGKLINDKGQLINKAGERINEKGERVNDFGETEAEETKRVCKRLSEIVDKALERLEPILDMINEHVDKASRVDREKEDLDEQALVDNLRPLLERGTTILKECYGAIKAVDPEGKASHGAQHRAEVSEATAEEQHLAQGLAKLAGDVTKTIEKAKELIKDMPHAKNNLGPLLEMFGEPLFQILGAVGMLLNGVLSLVVNILDGLGLGGIVRGLINGLGVGKLLKGIGLGKWLEKK